MRLKLLHFFRAYALGDEHVRKIGERQLASLQDFANRSFPNSAELAFSDFGTLPNSRVLDRQFRNVSQFANSHMLDYELRRNREFKDLSFFSKSANSKTAKLRERSASPCTRRTQHHGPPLVTTASFGIQMLQLKCFNLPNTFLGILSNTYLFIV